MISPFRDAIYVKSYCILAGFLALDADKQRALIPNRCESTYAAFYEGDGTFTRPLNILFHNLRDAAIHHGECEYSFIAESLNDALLNALGALYDAQWQDDDFFDTANLDAPQWNALRAASRDVWNALEEKYRLPFSNWRDFAG